MRKAVGSLLIVVALIAAGAGGYWYFTRAVAEPSPSAPSSLEPLTVANIGIFSVLNVIAEEKGMFTAHGLDVTMDEYDTGASSIAAVIAGKADVGIAADFVGVRNMFENQELMTMAQVSEHDVFRLVTRTDRGINEPKDLVGKKIGVAHRTASEFYLGLFLTFNGLTLADVQGIEMGPAEMREKIANGDIDGALIFEPHAFELEQEHGRLVRTWRAQGEQRALGLVYTTRGFVGRRADAAAKYLAALKDAQAWKDANPAEARAIVADNLSLDPRFVGYVWPMLRTGVTINQGMILTMEDQARWMMKGGIVPQTQVPNYLGRIFFDALEAADPAAVTAVH